MAYSTGSCGNAGSASREVILSRPPEGDSTSRFSVGSIPTREAGAAADGAVPVSVTTWPDAPVPVVTLAGNRRRFTWAGFFDTYANLWGGATWMLLFPSTGHIKAAASIWRPGTDTSPSQPASGLGPSTLVICPGACHCGAADRGLPGLGRWLVAGGVAGWGRAGVNRRAAPGVLVMVPVRVVPGGRAGHR